MAHIRKASAKAAEDKCLKPLGSTQMRQLLALPANKYCFECGHRGPSFVDLHIKTFVCTTCSGHLMRLGHRVKSVSMGIFSPVELETLSKGGNKVAYEKWMATFRPAEYVRPSANDHARMTDFLHLKYESKRWCRPDEQMSGEGKPTSANPTTPKANSSEKPALEPQTSSISESAVEDKEEPQCSESLLIFTLDDDPPCSGSQSASSAVMHRASWSADSQGAPKQPDIGAYWQENGTMRGDGGSAGATVGGWGHQPILQPTPVPWPPVGATHNAPLQPTTAPARGTSQQLVNPLRPVAAASLSASSSEAVREDARQLPAQPLWQAHLPSAPAVQVCGAFMHQAKATTRSSSFPQPQPDRPLPSLPREGTLPAFSPFCSGPVQQWGPVSMYPAAMAQNAGYSAPPQQAPPTAWMPAMPQGATPSIYGPQPPVFNPTITAHPPPYYSVPAQPQHTAAQGQPLPWHMASTVAAPGVCTRAQVDSADAAGDKYAAFNNAHLQRGASVFEPIMGAAAKPGHTQYSAARMTKNA